MNLKKIAVGAGTGFSVAFCAVAAYYNPNDAATLAVAASAVGVSAGMAWDIL